MMDGPEGRDERLGGGPRASALPLSPGTGFWPSFKRLLVGRALASEEAPHQRLPKILALPVFASDPLSSNAYATEEILLVLVLAGTSALRWALPISAVIAVVLTIVIVSYRQTVRAYPSGGGAYIVAKENLGETPGLIAAAALLTDYVLTVSVSIAAGAFALASLVPGLLPHRVTMSLAFIAFITLANLRGVRESGTLFAIPTYSFVFVVFVMVALGLARCIGGSCPQAQSAGQAVAAGQGLSLFLILRAFSSGSTALTGVEAIANGVPAFRGRRPSDQAHNAATTLAMLGMMTVAMFIGITFLAFRTDVVPSHERSVIAQVAHAIFGGGAGFAAVQITTALILVLAANTAYQDFPRLSSILARDRYMPRQFMNLGDRLVFSNGIFVLASIAAILVVVYDAEVTRLIQLYVVGVFTSFTLSQAGMVRRWRRLKASEPRWRSRAALNTFGASATGIVLVVIAATKFLHGAWIVIVAVPVIVTAFKAIHRHYMSIGHQLRVSEDRPSVSATTRVIVLADRMDEATLRAVGYARGMRPAEIRGLHLGSEDTHAAMSGDWSRRCVGVPLEFVPLSGRQRVDAIRMYVRALEPSESGFVTVVVPEILHRSGWRQFVRRREGLLLKAALLFEPHVVLTDVPTFAEDLGRMSARAVVPGRSTAIVLISAVHNATLQAVAYARSIRPTDLRAISFNLDPDESQRIIEDWGRRRLDMPLELVDSPYRDVSEPLLRYVRRVRDAQPDTVVTVILPEFVVRRWWHQFLHNQTALAIKAALLFEPQVVVTSVPYHLR